MSNYEILTALNGIDDKCILQARKTGKAAVIKWSALAACICVAVFALAVFLGRPDLYPFESYNSGTVYIDLNKVLWVYDKEGDNMATEEEIFLTDKQWEGKLVSANLYGTLAGAKADKLIAMNVAWKNRSDSDSYVYQGKTVSEWRAEMQNYAVLITKLPEFQKEAEYLKYGEKLYTEGAPDGTKYAQSLYEERIAYYGSELLDRYIRDGKLDSELLAEDSQAVVQKEKEAAQIMYEAHQAFLANKAKLMYDTLLKEGYNVVFKNNTLFLIISKADFSALVPALVSDYYFSPANRRAFEADSAPALKAPKAEFALDKNIIQSPTGNVKPADNKQATEEIQALVDRYYYSYDCIEVFTNTVNGTDKSIFKGLNAKSIDSVYSKYLPHDTHIILIPFDSIDLEKLAQLSNNPNVTHMSFGAPTSTDVADEGDTVDIPLPDVMPDVNTDEGEIQDFPVDD